VPGTDSTIEDDLGAAGAAFAEEAHGIEQVRVGAGEVGGFDIHADAVASGVQRSEGGGAEGHSGRGSENVENGYFRSQSPVHLHEWRC